MGIPLVGYGDVTKDVGEGVIPNPRFDFFELAVWLFQKPGLLKVMSYPLTQLPTFDIYILRFRHLVLKFSLIIIYIILYIIYIIIKISIYQIQTELCKKT